MSTLSNEADSVLHCIASLTRWRNNRVKSNFDTKDLDSAIKHLQGYYTMLSQHAEVIRQAPRQSIDEYARELQALYSKVLK